MDDMPDHLNVIDTYLAAYSESDGDTRRGLIAECFAPDATVVDPPLAAAGHSELDRMFEGLQQQFPQHVFVRTSDIDAHHDAARYSWALRGPDGTVAVTGTDVVLFGASGRLVRVTGFFGDLSDRS